MKLSVSSYSFGALRNSLGDLGIISLAKEIGFTGIEYADIKPPEGVSPSDHAKAIREECENLNMVCVNYTIGADLINGSEGDSDAEIERLCNQVDIAEILGASGMRHDATRGFKEDRGWRGFDDALPALIKGCRAVTEYAETKGIRTMVENHGYFCQDSDRMEKLVNGVAHKNFGLLVDIGNFLCVDENPVIATGRVAPYAFHVHAKDFHVKNGNGFVPPDGFFRSRGMNLLRGAIVGHGDVPVLQCLSILGSHGYDGFVSLEFEGMEEPEKGIRCGFNTLEAILEIL